MDFSDRFNPLDRNRSPVRTQDARRHGGGGSFRGHDDEAEKDEQEFEEPTDQVELSLENKAEQRHQLDLLQAALASSLGWLFYWLEHEK